MASGLNSLIDNLIEAIQEDIRNAHDLHVNPKKQKELADQLREVANILHAEDELNWEGR